MSDLFNRWSSLGRMHLMDIWGVDLFAHFEKLATLSPSSHRVVTSIINMFCREFAMGYISLSREWNASDPTHPEIACYERGKPRQPGEYLVTRQETILGFQDILTAVRTLRPAYDKHSEAAHCLQQIEQRFGLGVTFLQHPHAPALLCTQTVYTHHQLYPSAAPLYVQTSDKALQDLLTYVKFLVLGFAENIRINALTINPLFLQNLHQALINLSTTGDKREVLRKLKTDLSADFMHLGHTIQNLGESLAKADANNLTHEQYCREQNIILLEKKSKKEFMSALYFKLLQATFLNAVAHDCIDILDQEVMLPLFSDTFITTYTAFKRIFINTTQFFDIYTRGFHSTITLPALPPCTVPTSTITELSADLGKEMCTLLTSVNLYQEDLQSLIEHFEQLCKKNRIFYHQWIGFLNRLHPWVTLLYAQIPRLDALRRKYLDKIEQFLTTLDLNELRTHHETWTHFFEEIFYQSSLDYCQVMMLAKDIEAVATLGGDLSLLNSEEHLFPSPLLDFMTVEGLDELMDRLTFQPFYYLTLAPSVYVNPLAAPPPPPETSPRASSKPTEVDDKAPVRFPAKLAPTTPRSATPAKTPAKAAASQVTPPSAHSFEEASTPFRFRRGEKTHKLVQRLRDEGILPRTGKGRGTTHHEFNDEKGKKMHIPRGGSRHTEVSRRVQRSLRMAMDIRPTKKKA